MLRSACEKMWQCASDGPSKSAARNLTVTCAPNHPSGIIASNLRQDVQEHARSILKARESPGTAQPVTLPGVGSVMVSRQSPTS